MTWPSLEKRSGVAVIPVRKGSSRVRNKNTKPFAGKSLLEVKIEELWRSKYLDGIIVGTDCPQAKEICKKYYNEFVEVIEREDYFCDESVCSANEMIFDLVSKVPDKYDEVVWAHCTNPLLSFGTIDKAIESYVSSNALKGSDSLLTVTKIQSHLWNDLYPVNFNPLAERHQLASELEPLYYQNGALFIQTRQQFIDNKYFYGVRPEKYELDWFQSFDVNTPEEFDIAEILYKEKYNGSSR